MTYAERFYLAALVVAPVEKCAHLADPQMNVFLVEAFKNGVAFEQYLNEFVSYANGTAKEPYWHEQARQMIESR